jgi:hypothetical protein
MTNQIMTQDGVITPFAGTFNGLSREQLNVIKANIAAANKANAAELTDVTPIYWEAKAGESKTVSFLGYKALLKKDGNGNILKDAGGKDVLTFVARFSDGDRDVVMGQVGVIDAMQNAIEHDVFKITCIEAAKGKAKRFLVEQFNPSQQISND